MARSRPQPNEHVTSRAEPPAEKQPEAAKIAPGWWVALSVWAALFLVLVVYEAWGFFGGLLRGPVR